MSDPRIIEGLRASPFAAELEPAELETLAGEMTLHEFKEGEVLVAEGTADSHLYVVVEGVLGTVKCFGTPDAEKLTRVPAGALAGELAFIDGAVRYASLVALKPAVALGLDRSRLEALVDRHPQLVYHVMCAIVRVVHEVQRRLSMQSAELTNYVFKVHGRY